MSRGKVKRSATQAADPAVSSSTPIPGLFLAADVTFLVTEMGDFEDTVEATAVLVVVEVVADVAAAADIVILVVTCLTLVTSGVS